MKLLRSVSRVIVGLVFIFSGIVKAIDPLGSAYKFHDYFQAFNIGFLDKLSLPLAILLCTAEFIAGFAVLTGIRQKSGIIGVTILIAVFTPLTFILALTNPVSDCGCFGDAIHLTNWQTFLKNAVLVVLILILYTGIRGTKQLLKTNTEWSIISSAVIVFILFSLYNLRYLPVIDFLPYKTGVKIADKMIVPEGMPVDEYNTTFIYEKDGISKEFSLDNYPANDTTWKFVDQKTVLIKKGYKPPIHDFVITSMYGEDLTDKILNNPGFSVLMISKKLTQAGKARLDKGLQLASYFADKGIEFYVLTSSGTDEIKSFGESPMFCLADETTLKTMIRANPGYILLKEGTIIEKWSWANLPDKEWFEKKASESYSSDAPID